MKIVAQFALFAVVCNLVPVYRWWCIPPPVLLSGKAFGPVEVERFRKDERDRADIARAFRNGCLEGEGYISTVAKASKIFRIQPKIIAATIVAESTCRPDAISESGAVGLMQINERVWHRSRKELLDPDRNIQIGTEILASYVKQTGSTREGLKRYFGLTPGSTAADEYADRVLEISRR